MPIRGGCVYSPRARRHCSRKRLAGGVSSVSSPWRARETPMSSDKFRGVPSAGLDFHAQDAAGKLFLRGSITQAHGSIETRWCPLVQAATHTRYPHYLGAGKRLSSWRCFSAHCSREQPIKHLLDTVNLSKETRHTRFITAAVRTRVAFSTARQPPSRVWGSQPSRGLWGRMRPTLQLTRRSPFSH